MKNETINGMRTNEMPTIKIGCQNATYTNIVAFRVGNPVFQSSHAPNLERGRLCS
jgi:hypothetical protein